mgnify:CR=1 FL=1
MYVLGFLAATKDSIQIFTCESYLLYSNISVIRITLCTIILWGTMVRIAKYDDFLEYNNLLDTLQIWFTEQNMVL